MAFLTGGGANNIQSSNITDGTITNVDIAAAAAIARTKLDFGSGLVDADIAAAAAIAITKLAKWPTVEVTAGATASLTTVAGQTVIVWAKGTVDSNNNGRTMTLKYNGVTKDTVVVDGGLAGTSQLAFALMYTEVPGAGTQNITVAASIGSLTNVVIMVLKI